MSDRDTSDTDNVVGDLSKDTLLLRHHSLTKVHIQSVDCSHLSGEKKEQAMEQLAKNYFQDKQVCSYCYRRCELDTDRSE